MSDKNYRESQTPAQQLYSQLCGKAKVRPDPVVSEGLASKGLICHIDKWNANDISVVGMLSRRLKGYTHVSISYSHSNHKNSDDGRGGSSARRARNLTAAAGPEDEEITSLCASVSKSLQLCPKLTFIELPGIKMTHSGLRQLGRGLVATTSLRRLDMRSCGIGDDGLTVLVKALVACKSLNDLCLSGNRLKDSSAPRLSSIIRRHGARRDDGFWASCLRDGAMSAASSRGLEPTIHEIGVQLRGLTTLDISDNYLSNEGARHIATTLEGDGWLVALNMRGNQVSAEGAKAIKAALLINESLSVIDFRPREEPPKFDEMGHVIRSKKSHSRTEVMGWAMRRKPRKGIGAEHTEVHPVLTRWGLGGDTRKKTASPLLSRKSLLPRGSSVKKSTKKIKKTTTKTMTTKSSKQPTRMSRHKGPKKKAAAGAATTTATGTTTAISEIDSKRSSPSTFKRAAVKGTKKKSMKKKTTLRPKSAAATGRSTGRSNKERGGGEMMINSNTVGGSSLTERFASMERPKTASGRNRSRRRGSPLSRSSAAASSASSATHPGIVGLGNVEPSSSSAKVQLTKEAKHLLSTVFQQIQQESNIHENAVPVRAIIVALRDEPSAPTVLQFRGTNGNPPADLLEQGKTITLSSLIEFFQLHAKQIMSLSPRNKGRGGGGGGGGSRKEAWMSSSETKADPALLEALEGWVDQLHGYIDKLEQGVDLSSVEIPITTSTTKSTKSTPVTLSTPKKASGSGKFFFHFSYFIFFRIPRTDNNNYLLLLLTYFFSDTTTSLSEGMSPEQLQTLVASRLKELIQERSESGL